jgi:calcineurin-like phosphoesterase family protein
MRQTWFTSDTHFGHKMIMKYCPQRVGFLGLSDDEDIPAMNEALVEAWNSQVDPDDIVMFLGDFAMGNVRENLAYLGRLNGQVHGVIGNHDRPFSGLQQTPEKQAEWRRLYAEAGFISQREDGFYNFPNGITALMNHFPYHGDSADHDRYEAFRPQDDGYPLVHGHIHDLWQVNGRQINVGFDAWGRLLTEGEVGHLCAKALG